MTVDVITSFNATINDVKYPVAWTLGAIVPVAMLSVLPFIYPIKTWHALVGNNNAYTRSKFLGDIILASLAYLVWLTFFILAWTGYLGVLFNFSPNGYVQVKPIGLTSSYDKFCLAISATVLFWLTEVFIYRIYAYAKTEKTVSTGENEKLNEELKEQNNASLLKMTRADFFFFDVSYIHLSGASVFLRIFWSLLCLYGFLLLIVIYPYSIDGYILSINTFGVSAALNLVTGICLVLALVLLHFNSIPGAGARALHGISYMIGNTDIVTFSYADTLKNFSVSGHIQTFYVPRVWAVSFGFYFYTVMYMLTCSLTKTNTFVLCTFGVSFVLSILSQNRATFLPFLMVSMFMFITFIYMIQWWVPVPYGTTDFDNTNLTQAYVINMNYMTTAANCTSAALQYDNSLIFSATIFGLALSIWANIESLMFKFPVEAKPENKTEPNN